MAKDREQQSQDFNKSLSGVEKINSQERSMAQAVGETSRRNSADQLKLLDLNNKLGMQDIKQDMPILQKMSIIMGVPIEQLVIEYNKKLMNP
jgi:hypothetical protein